MYELIFMAIGACVAMPFAFLWGTRVERGRLFKGYRLVKPKNNVLPFNGDKFSNSPGRAA